MPEQDRQGVVGGILDWAVRPAQTLPVSASLYFPVPTSSGLVQIAVPAGTPVHAVGSGRVTDADADRVGEVVVRLECGERAHYRRLAPSSVQVQRGDVVESGQLVGVVATSVGGGPADGGLLFGLQSDDDCWIDPATTLMGATDPAQFGIPALRRAGSDVSANLVTAVSSARDERARSFATDAGDTPPSRENLESDVTSKPPEPTPSSEPASTEPALTEPTPTGASALNSRLVSRRPRPTSR